MQLVGGPAAELSIFHLFRCWKLCAWRVSTSDAICGFQVATLRQGTSSYSNWIHRKLCIIKCPGDMKSILHVCLWERFVTLILISPVNVIQSVSVTCKQIDICHGSYTYHPHNSALDSTHFTGFLRICVMFAIIHKANPIAAVSIPPHPGIILGIGNCTMKIQTTHLHCG